MDEFKDASVQEQKARMKAGKERMKQKADEEKKANATLTFSQKADAENAYAGKKQK